MVLLPDKLIIPPNVSYLLLDKGLGVVESSDDLIKFAMSAESLQPNTPVGDVFPELIGAEDVLDQIHKGSRRQYEIREICRGRIYFNLYVHRIDAYLVVLCEEVTEMMVLKQSLVQRANEAELLLSALRNSKDYLDKVVLSMGDALIITNGIGKIKAINQAAIDIFKYDEAEVSEQPFSMLIGTSAAAEGLTPEAIATHGSSIKNVEVDCLTKTGEHITLEFNCSRVLTDLDQNESFVYIGRNITARKQAELKRQEAIAKERELVELRARFLSTASHEFRNPIGSILMCTELLQNPKISLTEEEQNMYINFIQEAGQNLKNVVEDVLMLSKSSAGKVKFKPTALNLKRFCENLIQQMHLSMNDERVQSQYKLSGDLELVQMDGKLLQHILQNILSNALKYSPEGKPVEFTVQPTDIQSQNLDFVVRDYGIGIPPKDLEHIFDSFHRASNVGEIPGTGLGMAITHKYIEIHKGSIQIESEVNVGTTITITLPNGADTN